MPERPAVSAAWRWYLLAALIVVLDQASKALVLARLQPGERIYVAPFWNWVLTFNPGASFSLFADAGGWQRWLLSALAIGVAVWITLLLRRHASERLLALAFTLIMGGALGNVIDRIRFGAVVDFVQWHAAGFYWPAFNLADAAIVAGAALLLCEQLFTRRPSDLRADR